MIHAWNWNFIQQKARNSCLDFPEIIKIILHERKNLYILAVIVRNAGVNNFVEKRMLVKYTNFG